MTAVRVWPDECRFDDRAWVLGNGLSADVLRVSLVCFGSTSVMPRALKMPCDGKAMR